MVRGKIRALLFVGLFFPRFAFALGGECFREYIAFAGLRVRSFQMRGDDKLLQAALNTSEQPGRTKAAIRQVEKERANTSLVFDREGNFAGGAIYRNSPSDIEILDVFSLPGASSREVCTAVVLRILDNLVTRPSGIVRMRLRSSARADQELLRSVGFKLTQFDRAGFSDGEDAMIFSYPK